MASWRFDLGIRLDWLEIHLFLARSYGVMRGYGTCIHGLGLIDRLDFTRIETLFFFIKKYKKLLITFL
jgi:hypothetical protein